MKLIYYNAGQIQTTVVTFQTEQIMPTFPGQIPGVKIQKAAERLHTNCTCKCYCCHMGAQNNCNNNRWEKVQTFPDNTNLTNFPISLVQLEADSQHTRCGKVEHIRGTCVIMRHINCHSQ